MLCILLCHVEPTLGSSCPTGIPVVSERGSLVGATRLQCTISHTWQTADSRQQTAENREQTADNVNQRLRSSRFVVQAAAGAEKTGGSEATSACGMLAE